jgi:uncharacterized protein (TIGR02466 family)
MRIENLFPTPVGFFELDRPVSAAELAFVKALEPVRNMGNSNSLNTYVLKAPELNRIESFIRNSVETYFQEVHQPKSNVKPYITQSWANYTDKGEHHHRHFHSNSFISGVFYVAADSDKDRIHFYNDAYAPIKILSHTFNTWNSDSWWFPVAAGSLVLFPSRLSHMVETVEAEDTRISIAFNVFLSGTVGDERLLTELVL